MSLAVVQFEIHEWRACGCTNAPVTQEPVRLDLKQIKDNTLRRTHYPRNVCGSCGKPWYIRIIERSSPPADTEVFEQA